LALGKELKILESEKGRNSEKMLRSTGIRERMMQKNGQIIEA